MTAWTLEHDTLLKQCWQDGVSCSQIAVRLNTDLGTTFSRNAVIGRVHRLGLHDQFVRCRKAVRISSRKRKRVQVRPGRKSTYGGEVALVESQERTSAPDLAAYDAAIPVEQRRTVLEMNDGTCRWPVGDPGQAGFFFCGAQPAPDKPYCSVHSAVAFVPYQRKPSAWLQLKRRRAA